MSKKIKILFSSDDFGSLQQNLYLIKLLKEKRIIDLKNSIFICNKQFRKDINQKIITKIFFLKDLNIKNKRKIIYLTKINRIDLAVVGLSIRPHSIDYKITEMIKKENITTVSIQDFWGFIGNFNKKNYPDYLFVADNYSKELSKKKIPSKIIVSGLPKYIKKKPLIKLRNNNQKGNLLIIGQPDYIPGINLYFNFLKKADFSNFANKFYLPHPMEKKPKDFFKKKKVEIINRNILHKKLGNKFLVINAFSTLSYDIIFSANFEKKNFLYKVIFLTFPKRLLNFIRKIVGSDKLPLNNHKNIYQLSNYKNSVIEIEKVFKKQFFECSSTKKYFLKNHSEKIFLKRFRQIVRK